MVLLKIHWAVREGLNTKMHSNPRPKQFIESVASQWAGAVKSSGATCSKVSNENYMVYQSNKENHRETDFLSVN